RGLRRPRDRVIGDVPLLSRAPTRAAVGAALPQPHRQGAPGTRCWRHHCGRRPEAVKKILLIVVALGVLAVGVGAAFVIVRERQSRDVRGSSTVEFVTTQETIPTIPKALRSVQWPMYGFDAERERAIASDLRPPYRKVCVAGGRSLL